MIAKLDEVIAEFRKGNDKYAATYKSSPSNNTYSYTMKALGSAQNADDLIVQVNVSTQVQRKIALNKAKFSDEAFNLGDLLVDPPKPPPPPKALPVSSWTRDQKGNFMYGDAFIQLPAGYVKTLLNAIDWTNRQEQVVASKPLAYLAQQLMEILTIHTGLVYAKGSRTPRCELWIKPVLLFQWLSVLNSRNFKYIRVGYHGASANALQGVRDDPLGFTNHYAGQQGSVHGIGTYWGMTDHVAAGYNTTNKTGKYILSLLLSDKDVQRSASDNGVHPTYDSHTKAYSSFKLSNQTKHNNCLVYRDRELQLILGSIEPAY
jgi:hypothetical protein